MKEMLPFFPVQWIGKLKKPVLPTCISPMSLKTEGFLCYDVNERRDIQYFSQKSDNNQGMHWF